jgi:hypothetical protein
MQRRRKGGLAEESCGLVDAEGREARSHQLSSSTCTLAATLVQEKGTRFSHNDRSQKNTPYFSAPQALATIRYSLAATF